MTRKKEERLTVQARDVFDEYLHRLLFARAGADARDAGASAHGGGCACALVVRVEIAVVSESVRGAWRRK